MAKVTGSVVLYFEDIEFEDEGGLDLRDQAVDALRGEVFSCVGDIADIQIDEVKE